MILPIAVWVLLRRFTNNKREIKMPNWCECDLYVSGPSRSVNNFMSRASKEEGGETVPFQIDALVPMPEILRGSVSGSAERYHQAVYGDLTSVRSQLSGWGYEVITREEAVARMAEHFGVSEDEVRRQADGYQRNMDETGFRTWYDWCMANWGVKWDASDVEVASVTEESGLTDLTISFRTPWGPPSEGMATISRRFPDIRFRLEYFECGMGFKGVQVYESGEVVEYSSSDYDGDRGG